MTGIVNPMDVDFGRYNIVAAYPDIETARRVIESLEEHGVKGSDISLLGRQAEQSDDPARAEAGEGEQIDLATRTAVKGVATGSGIGAGVGFLAGLAAFGIPGIGPAIGGGIWAMTVGGAAAGGGVGLAVNAYARIKQSEAWEQTFAAVSEGQVIVGVHGDTAGDVDKAAAVLRDHSPQWLRWFDYDGNPIEEPAH